MKEQKFGEFLQNERNRLGITQGKLANVTGFTVRAISLWENGKREITLKNAEIVVNALGTSLTIGKAQTPTEQ